MPDAEILETQARDLLRRLQTLPADHEELGLSEDIERRLKECVAIWT